MVVYAQTFKLVVPHSIAKNAAGRAAHALAAQSGEHDKLQVYSGTQAVQNYGVSVVTASRPRTTSSSRQPSHLKP